MLCVYILYRIVISYILIKMGDNKKKDFSHEFKYGNYDNLHINTEVLNMDLSIFNNTLPDSLRCFFTIRTNNLHYYIIEEEYYM